MPTPAPMTAGVTQQGSSVNGVVWHILGQTYTPLEVTESSFSWHALLPPGWRTGSTRNWPTGRHCGLVR